MNFYFPPRFWQAVTVVAVTVILFLVVIIAISSGKAKAQSQTVLDNKNQIVKSLGYFYSDQNRFPTAEEFADQNVMGQYVGNFPPQQFSSGICPQSFVYKRPDAQSYQLYFCLPQAINNFTKGWNMVGGQK